MDTTTTTAPDPNEKTAADTAAEPTVTPEKTYVTPSDAAKATTFILAMVVGLGMILFLVAVAALDRTSELTQPQRPVVVVLTPEQGQTGYDLGQPQPMPMPEPMPMPYPGYDLGQPQPMPVPPIAIDPPVVGQPGPVWDLMPPVGEYPMPTDQYGNPGTDYAEPGIVMPQPELMPGEMCVERLLDANGNPVAERFVAC